MFLDEDNKPMGNWLWSGISAGLLHFGVPDASCTRTRVAIGRARYGDGFAFDLMHPLNDETLHMAGTMNYCDPPPTGICYHLALYAPRDSSLGMLGSCRN